MSTSVVRCARFTSDAGEKTSFGGLQDEDRIFTNLYGKHDPFLQVRARPGRTTDDVVADERVERCPEAEADRRIRDVRRCRVHESVVIGTRPKN